VNPHVAVTVRESVAVHATDVVPGLNALPEAGVQAVVTGAEPPAVVGEAYVTVMGFQSGACTC
jgi:hypothetical protein